VEDRFKFRVWWDNEMIYSEVVCEKRDYSLVNFEHGYSVYPNLLEDYGEKGDEDACFIPAGIMMQCTGLKDTDGNLIYEGDILDDRGTKGICFWGTDAWWIKLTNQDSFRANRWIDRDYTKIIGNIYEQPELINENN